MGERSETHHLHQPALGLTCAAVVGWVSDATPITVLAATQAMGLASLTHPYASHGSIVSTIGIIPTAHDTDLSVAPATNRLPQKNTIKTDFYFSLPLVGRVGVGVHKSHSFGPLELHRQRPGVRGGITRLDRRPVQHIPPGRQIIGAAVLIFQVIRVLPDIIGEQHTPAFHQRRVLIWP